MSKDTTTTWNCTWTPSDKLTVQDIGPYTHFCINDVTDVVLEAEDALALALQILIKRKDRLTPEEADGIRSELPMAEVEETAVNLHPRFSSLNPQAQLVYQHMVRAGSISARDAFDDHGITSATLSRRICDIEVEGFKVVRESKKHPVTERRYTRYSLKDQPPLALPHYPE